MNAQVAIAEDLRARSMDLLAGLPHLQQYVATVEALRPCTHPDQMRQRCGILYLRDWSAAHVGRASHEASFALNAITSLATLHAFRTMTPKQLDVLHRSLIGLMSIATQLDHDGPHDEYLNG